MRKGGVIRLLFSMEKVKVIALKSFEYDRVIRTPQSPAFEVNKLEFSFFESNKMVSLYKSPQGDSETNPPIPTQEDTEINPSIPTPKKKGEKDVFDNTK